MRRVRRFHDPSMPHPERAGVELDLGPTDPQPQEPALRVSLDGSARNRPYGPLVHQGLTDFRCRVGFDPATAGPAIVDTAVLAAASNAWRQTA